MLSHGLQLAKGYITQIERHINRIDGLAIDGSFKISLRVGVGILPGFVGSLLSFKLTPLFVMASVLLIYWSSKPIQQQLFNLGNNEKYWHISVPVHVFLIAWSLLLWLIGYSHQISRSLGAMVLLLAVTLWPVYMGKKAYGRKKRMMPFNVAYVIVASLVVLQQLIFIGGKG